MHIIYIVPRDPCYFGRSKYTKQRSCALERSQVVTDCSEALALDLHQPTAWLGPWNTRQRVKHPTTPSMGISGLKWRYWPYKYFLGISPYIDIGLIYGRYLQFRILEWPLTPWQCRSQFLFGAEVVGVVWLHFEAIDDLIVPGFMVITPQKKWWLNPRQNISVAKVRLPHSGKGKVWFINIYIYTRICSCFSIVKQYLTTMVDCQTILNHHILWLNHHLSICHWGPVVFCCWPYSAGPDASNKRSWRDRWTRTWLEDVGYIYIWIYIYIHIYIFIYTYIYMYRSYIDICILYI